jgi:hypothetical protein
MAGQRWPSLATNDDDPVARELRVARERALRAHNEIGDDAFHLMEEELDWLEMAHGGTG